MNKLQLEDPNLFGVLKTMKNMGRRTSIQNFVQYTTGRWWGDLGKCLECKTLCRIRTNKNGVDYLVNVVDNQYHRNWEKGAKYKCVVPKTIVISEEVRQKTLNEVKKINRRNRITEVPVQTARDSGIDVYDD